jgi:hypothetical protein
MLMMMEMLLQGYFEHGKRDGHGTMRMANGDLWVGEYKANLRHGMGVYKQALTGVKEASRWHRDRRVGEGVRWQPEEGRAARIVNGRRVKSISFEEAKLIANKLKATSGLKVVDKKEKAKKSNNDVNNGGEREAKERGSATNPPTNQQAPNMPSEEERSQFSALFMGARGRSEQGADPASRASTVVASETDASPTTTTTTASSSPISSTVSDPAIAAAAAPAAPSAPTEEVAQQAEDDEWQTKKKKKKKKKGKAVADP